MVNSCHFVGNLGKDPELKEGENWKVAKFPLGVNSKYKDKEETEWVNVEVWNKTAENVSKYLKKGSKAYVEGRLKTESYEKDGVKKYATKVVARTVQFLDSKSDNQKASEEAAPSW